MRNEQADRRERTVRIPVSRPRLPTASTLLQYLARIDESRVYTNHGPLVLEFERELARLLGLRPGTFVSASSGTAAIVGAILAVAGRASAARPLALLPAFTYTATAIAVELCGYRPHLMDVDPETWMLEPAPVLAHPDLSRVGIVVPVAPFGRVVPQAPWREVRQRTGIPIVIDGAACFDLMEERATEGLGSIPVAMSFHATKSFSTAEGGCIVTTDASLATLAGEALNFGFRDDRETRCASTNGKMSEYHAAIGLAEVNGWREKLSALLDVAALYRSAAQDAEIREQIVIAPDVSSCYTIFRARSPSQTHAVLRALEANGIDCRLWYGGGLHKQPYFRNSARDENLNVTEIIAADLIGLPVAPDLDRGKVARVVAALRAGISAS